MLDRLELSPLGDRALMDVAAENELGSRGHEALEDEIAPAQRAFVGGTPGW